MSAASRLSLPWFTACVPWCRVNWRRGAPARDQPLMRLLPALWRADDALRSHHDPHPAAPLDGFDAPDGRQIPARRHLVEAAGTVLYDGAAVVDLAENPALQWPILYGSLRLRD